MDLEREAAAARAAAEAAGAIIARHAAGARKSWDKAEDNPVTHADLEANRAILAVLERSFPCDAILSEETRDSPERRRAERLWVIDPLDGTKEFVEGVPEFAVSIGLVIRGEPVVGVVQQPLTGELFWGVQGGGAWLGGTRLHVAATRRLEESRVLSSRTELGRGQLERQRGWFREVVPVGSAALKLACVAAARADLWFSVAPKSEWDVCAGDLLVREAGGLFLSLDAGPRSYNCEDVLLQPPLVAGAPALVEAFVERWRAC